MYLERDEPEDKCSCFKKTKRTVFHKGHNVQSFNRNIIYINILNSLNLYTVKCTSDLNNPIVFDTIVLL